MPRISRDRRSPQTAASSCRRQCDATGGVMPQTGFTKFLQFYRTGTGNSAPVLFSNMLRVSSFKQCMHRRARRRIHRRRLRRTQKSTPERSGPYFLPHILPGMLFLMLYFFSIFILFFSGIFSEAEKSGFHRPQVLPLYAAISQKFMTICATCARVASSFGSSLPSEPLISPSPTAQIIDSSA